MHSVTMKRARPRRLPPASAIFLFFAAYLFYGDVSATNHDGYAYVGYGGCRDSNGNVYSNIRLPDATAAHDDSVCGQSCDIFRASGKLRGFEWLLVGSSKRCYCLLDAGTDVDTMAQEVEGGGATGKGDNDGVGEIVSAENVGIDSYCHKVIQVVTEDEEGGDQVSSEGTRVVDFVGDSPTPTPHLDEIFESIFTTSQVDEAYGSDWSPTPTLNVTKSSKVFAGWGKAPKSASLKSFKSSWGSMNICSKSSKAYSMSHGMKSSSGSWSRSGGWDWNSVGSSSSWSQSMKSKSIKVCSKSGQFMSYSVEGKSNKGADMWSMTFEQVRYKMGSGGHRSEGKGLMMMQTMLIGMYLAW